MKCNLDCPYYAPIKLNFGYCNNDLCVDGFVQEGEKCRIEQIKQYFTLMKENK